MLQLKMHIFYHQNLLGKLLNCTYMCAQMQPYDDCVSVSLCPYISQNTSQLMRSP